MMAAMKEMASTLKELLSFLMEQKRYWMIPMVLFMVAFAALIVLGNSTGLGPFVYTLF